MKTELPIIKKYIPTFSNVSTDVVGKYFILPANTPFWAIALQMTIFTNKPLTIKITNTCIHDDSVFGVIQTESYMGFGNHIGVCYIEKYNGEIQVAFNKLTPK